MEHAQTSTESTSLVALLIVLAAVLAANGVYEIRDGHLTWRPAIDADRLARGGQILAAIAIASAALILRRPR